MANIFRQFIGRWVDGARRLAWLVVSVSILITGGSAWYVATHLSIDTDTTGMLAAELPFRQDSIQLRQAFPQFANNIVVVIEGPTPDQTDDGAFALGKALRADTRLFREVFDPRGEKFFRENGLLFLDLKDVEGLVDRLASAQAFLGSLWRDPSLRGLFSVLQLAVENTDGTTPPGSLQQMIEKVTAATEAASSGSVNWLSWKSLIDDSTGNDVEARRRIIIVQPALDSATLQPAGHAIAGIRNVARTLALTPAQGFRIRLTGSAAIEEEELESVAEGMGIAGILSAVLVCGLLFWGLRSGRLVFAMLLTLVFGLLWTACLATLVVGSLNLISVAFAVLFIGLSVDFGIHLTLRITEKLTPGSNLSDACLNAGQGVGGALTLCAVAAAISFFSFVFTDYVGLAELGKIAGMGMFVALFANLTVLPALISLMPPRDKQTSRIENSNARKGWVISNARKVVVVTVLLALGATMLTPQIHFDFDPMNLRDPDTESVKTLLDLTKNSDTGPYSIDILASDRKTAQALQTRLEGLTTVDHVLALDGLIPNNQNDKLAVIDQAAFLLLPAFRAKRQSSPTDTERKIAIQAFENFLQKRGDAFPDDVRASLDRLRLALSKVSKSPAGLRDLERHLLGNLEGRLVALKEAMNAVEVSAASLPMLLKRRFIGATGQVRLEVFPKFDLKIRKNLVKFVADVRAIAPRATGSPVIIIEAGNAVVGAFVKAALISVITIAILVVVLLRNLRDVLLVFAPLTLAALFTIAATVLFNLPFNFANVIVLPLLFGLGVASAIHIVMRERDESGQQNLMETSTPRAVVFSALTTIGSFASIALSSHPGTASMGILLAISIGFTLICTICFLPALMACLRLLADDK
ncbi:MAG: MMPL family transporter [Alphaproteobacteria bacterium]|nr:MMPL family transporter [Alphaproteobacteria bacterium]